jgi:hypothetical protein
MDIANGIYVSESSMVAETDSRSLLHRMKSHDMYDNRGGASIHHRRVTAALVEDRNELG